MAGSAELERMRQIEEMFAEANEQIRDAAERNYFDPVPFLCECSATTWMELIHLPLDAYRKLRERAYRKLCERPGFIVCPGHDDRTSRLLSKTTVLPGSSRTSARPAA